MEIKQKLTSDFELLEEIEFIEMTEISLKEEESKKNKYEIKKKTEEIKITIPNKIIDENIIGEDEKIYQDLQEKKIIFTFHINNVDCDFILQSKNNKHLYIISKFFSNIFDFYLCSIL
jgi:hypothetical protein